MEIYPHTLELFHKIRGTGKRRIIDIFFSGDVSRRWVQSGLDQALVPAGL
jgi:hypothetical protein